MSFSIPTRLLVMHGLFNMMFLIPVVMQFYQHIGGVTVADFLLMQGLFRLGALMLEIPTGYLADHWQRQRQMQAAMAIHACAHLVLLTVASSFAHILGAELLMALASAFMSGTLAAYLFEALRNQGQEHTLSRHKSRLFMVAMAAEVLAAPIGGWLYGLHTHAPVAMGVGVDVLAFVVALTLPQVPRQQGQRRHAHPLANLWAIAHHGLRQHPLLAGLSMGPYVLLGLTGVLFWGMLAQVQALGISPFYQSMVLSGHFAFSVLAAWGTPRLIQRVPSSILWPILTVMVAVGAAMLIWAPSVWVVVGSSVLLASFRAVVTNLCETTMHQHVQDHERATLLSVSTFVTLLVSATFMLAAPMLLARMSMAMYLGLATAVTLIIALPAMVRLTRLGASQT